MIDLLVGLAHFCASCVSDSNVIPPALGALGGAAGAAGGLAGIGSLGSGGGDAGAGGAGEGAGSGGSANGAKGAPASRPTPIGDQGAAPDLPDQWGVGKNPDGGKTITYGGTRTTKEPGGGPTPIDDNMPGNLSDPQPITDTTPSIGPTPIGDQGAAPDLPGQWGVGKNPDGGHTITYDGTRTTSELGGGPAPIDDNMPGNLSDPQPITDTTPSIGPTPIGDQGAAPDLPDQWGVGKNPDGGHTITYDGTRTTSELGGGPAPIDDNMPGNLSDPQPITDTTPSIGPTPIGDQGAAPDLPDQWGVGKNPDGGHTITYGGTRTTSEPSGGPTPIDDNMPGNQSDPQPFGDTTPSAGQTPSTAPTTNTNATAGPDSSGTTLPSEGTPADANSPPAATPAQSGATGAATPSQPAGSPFADTAPSATDTQSTAPGAGNFENSPPDPNSPMGPSKFGETTEIDLISPNAPKATPSLGTTGTDTGANSGTPDQAGTGIGHGAGGTVAHKPPN